MLTPETIAEARDQLAIHSRQWRALQTADVALAGLQEFARVQSEVEALTGQRDALRSEIVTLGENAAAARAQLADARSELATERATIERERRAAAEAHAAAMAANAAALAEAEARLATVRGEVEALLARIGGARS